MRRATRYGRENGERFSFRRPCDAAAFVAVAIAPLVGAVGFIRWKISRGSSGAWEAVEVWEEQLERARETLATFDETVGLAQAERVSVSWVGSDARYLAGVLDPRPVEHLLPRRSGLPSGVGVGRVRRFGLDAAGRPTCHVVLQQPPWLAELVVREDDGTVVHVDRRVPGAQYTAVRRVAGDGNWCVAAVSWGTVAVTRFGRDEEGRVVRIDSASGGHSDDYELSARTVHRDVDGEITVVLEARAEMPGPSDWEALLGQAAALVPREVVYDARRDRPEPWPGDQEARALVEPLVEALTGAIAQGIAEDCEDAWLVHVDFSERWAQRRLPPRVLADAATARAQLRRMRGPVAKRLERYLDGIAESDDTTATQIDVIDRLDEQALRACRVLDQGFRRPPPRAGDIKAMITAGDLITEVARRLTAALVRQGDGDWLPVVQHTFALSGAFEDAAGWLREAGADLNGLDGPQRRRPSRKRLDLAATDRDALTQLLASEGIDSQLAGMLARDSATIGVRLVATEGTRSRLGGDALLPAGATWPVAVNGRPLSFLAALDLAELGAQPPLPTTGWLLAYGDLEDCDADGMVVPADNAEGSTVRMYYSATTPEAATPPPELTHALHPRHIAGAPELTLPETGIPGLDTAAQTAVAATMQLLNSRHGDAPQHWLGGHPIGIQVPSNPDSVLLLQLGWDPELRFEIGDGAHVQFRIASDALTAHEWSRVFTQTDMH